MREDPIRLPSGREQSLAIVEHAGAVAVAPLLPSGELLLVRQYRHATGTWLLETHHSAGVSTPTVTITQTGEKLSGKYVGSYGESELTGNIKDNKEFTFRVDIGTEQKVTVVYTGTLDGDTVKGSMTMGEMGEGTFTGKRK